MDYPIGIVKGAVVGEIDAICEAWESVHLVASRASSAEEHHSSIEIRKLFPIAVCHASNCVEVKHPSHAKQSES